jgi:hypothetical protein
MACVAKLLTEVRLDGQMVRLALVATIPLFATFSLFFMIVITGSLFQLFGPLPEKNSRFYSCEYPALMLVFLKLKLRRDEMSKGGPPLKFSVSWPPPLTKHLNIPSSR